MLYNVGVTFETVDEILECDHSNERYLLVSARLSMKYEGICLEMNLNTSVVFPSGRASGISMDNRSLMKANMIKVDRSLCTSSNTLGPAKGRQTMPLLDHGKRRTKACT